MLWLLMLGTMRALYELSNATATPGNPSPENIESLSVDKETEAFTSLSPMRRQWAEKAVAGYIRQQEKKWRRWDQAMFKAKYSSGS